MAGSVNKVILIGNLGGDPEIKTFDNGGSLAKFSLATTESWKDRETGEKKSETTWHNIVVRSQGLIKVVEQYLKKGMPVYVEGRIKNRSYDKNGEKHYITEIIVEEFTMLGGNKPSDGSSYEAQAQAANAAVEHEKDDLPF